MQSQLSYKKIVITCVAREFLEVVPAYGLTVQQNTDDMVPDLSVMAVCCPAGAYRLEALSR